MAAALEITPELGTAPVCHALGLARATLYRRRRPPASRPRRPRPRPARALSTGERETVLEVLHSERFCDQSPREVHAALLEEGQYHCSPRTMYRLLSERNEVRERRDQLRHPAYSAPELLATKPNQVWSWDITKLKTLTKSVCFQLYVMLDLFSRYVVGWLLAGHESAGLAARLVSESCAKQGVREGELTIHADRGPAMRSKALAEKLEELGIAKSHSRPRVSNDNPFSEAQFRTLKYWPGFPDRFESVAHAREICRAFFAWYNHRHHHSGLCFLTPAVVHHGRAQHVLADRHRVQLAAYRAHPERFVNGPPRLPRPPAAVWINPPKETTRQDAPGSTIVDPNDPEVVPIRITYAPLVRPEAHVTPLAASSVAAH
jgi:putative transposase